MNPILSQLRTLNSPNLISQIQNIKNMIAGKDPDEFFNELLRDDPKFRKFYEENKGKTPEQIARESGIDINLLK